MATFGTTQQVETFKPGTTQEEDQAALNAFLSGGGIDSAFSQLGNQANYGPGINNLKDFTDINKLANPANTAGLNTDLAGIGSKFKDMGAKFGSSQDMSNMLGQLEQPNVTNFTGANAELSGLMGSLKSNINDMTGTGNGPRGLPNIQDVLGPAMGCPEITAFNAVAEGSYTAAEIEPYIDNIRIMIQKSEGLIETAGVDLNETPGQTLSSHMNAAASLRKIGAENNGMGAREALMGMLDNSMFGDSIKVAMIEGKNDALLAQYGMSQPQFNPFEGLPAGGDANIASQNASNLLNPSGGR